MQKKKEQVEQGVHRDKFDPVNTRYFEELKKREEIIKAYEERPNYLNRKLNRIFGGLGQSKDKFLFGFKQGIIVGAVIGAVTGVIASVKAGRWYIFVASTVISATSFGSIMGVAQLIRSTPQHPTKDVPLQPYLHNIKWIMSEKKHEGI